MKKQFNMFDAQRITFNEQEQLTIQSMKAYGPRFKHWAMCWSGGKDSTALVTYVIYLIESGQIDAPKTITIFFADTRLELLPLFFSAQQIMKKLEEKGIKVHTVMADLDDRFFVYMFGRGVPPPSNTFRWCTPKLKIDPIERKLKQLYDETGEKFLLLTGVRQGESAQRDGRIAMSCGKDGAECGQGWYQTDKRTDAICDKLAPLLHWRVCSIWDWLKVIAPMPKNGGWPTQMVADSYGGDEAEEKNARTGCVGCNLASKDVSLLLVVSLSEWAYLSPLLRLREIYAELKKPHNRLRKTGFEARKDGSLSKNQNRMGPLTFDARLWGLNQVLEIQKDINTVAIATKRPTIDLINDEEESRIRELISLSTWPQGWSGEEQRADEFFLNTFSNGSVQTDLFGK